MTKPVLMLGWIYPSVMSVLVFLFSYQVLWSSLNCYLSMLFCESCETNTTSSRISNRSSRRCSLLLHSYTLRAPKSCTLTKRCMCTLLSRWTPGARFSSQHCTAASQVSIEHNAKCRTHTSFGWPTFEPKCLLNQGWVSRIFCWRDSSSSSISCHRYLSARSPLACSQQNAG